jgi:Ca2+-binding EF-hand superfamily protein
LEEDTMRMRTAVTWAAAAMLTVVSFARADDDGRKGREKSRVRGHDEAAAESREAKFRSWDRDGSGAISRSEYPGHPGNFRALDTDNDGQLTYEEFQHHAGAGAPSTGTIADDFTAKDHDGNGMITRAEWPDAFEFDRRDRNRDGLLSREEYFSPREPAAGSDEFGRLDTNDDGVIARAEWRGRPSVFDAIDGNRDGRITRDEYARRAGSGRLVK